MSELSIFIDESGDFGSNSEYYLLTLVFHDQANCIGEEVVVLKRTLAEAGLPPGQAVHAGPIVRKEDEYASLPLSTRRTVFGCLYAFTRKTKVSYFTIVVKKKECSDRILLKNRLARELSLFFRDHMDYFLSFDKVIVYYDNGQSPVTELVGTVCGSVFFDVDYRRVIPSDYRLFQSADLLCTLELVSIKADAGKLSRSEEIFFESRRKLKKNYLDKLEKLRFRVHG